VGLSRLHPLSGHRRIAGEPLEKFAQHVLRGNVGMIWNISSREVSSYNHPVKKIASDLSAVFDSDQRCSHNLISRSMASDSLQQSAQSIRR
jgi:hypothetical protein